MRWGIARLAGTTGSMALVVSIAACATTTGAPPSTTALIATASGQNPDQCHRHHGCRPHIGQQAAPRCTAAAAPRNAGESDGWMSRNRPARQVDHQHVIVPCDLRRWKPGDQHLHPQRASYGGHRSGRGLPRRGAAARRVPRPPVRGDPRLHQAESEGARQRGQNSETEFRVQITNGEPVRGSPLSFLNSEFCILNSVLFAVSADQLPYAAPRGVRRRRRRRFVPVHPSLELIRALTSYRRGEVGTVHRHFGNRILEASRHRVGDGGRSRFDRGRYTRSGATRTTPDRRR